MDKFLEKENLPKVDSRKMANINYPITIKESNLQLKTFPKRNMLSLETL